MKARLIDTHLLVPRSRSSAKVKVKYQGHVSQKMDVSGALVFHKHILFILVIRFYQEYVEPDENTPANQAPLRRDVNPLHPQAPATVDEDKVLLPLGENILSQNLGIPIIVVITKVSTVYQMMYHFILHHTAGF